MKCIYMDHNATTLLREEVLEAMLQTCQHLEKRGFGVTCPAVDQCHPWLHATQRRDKDVGARDGNIQRVKTKQGRQRG